MREILSSIESEYRRYKLLAEGAIQQLSEPQLAEADSGTGNSVATLAWHIAGNFQSRFTDFLSTDGEKPDRDRDSEFLPREVTKALLLEYWEGGWATLFGTLQELSDEDLARTVTIRDQSLAVHAALHRSLGHASYHVGQIVFLAKSLLGPDWQYMSIPPGQSSAYNETPTMEKGPRDIPRS